MESNSPEPTKLHSANLPKPNKKKGYSYKKARNERRRKAKLSKQKKEPSTPPRELTKAELRQLQIQSDMEAAADLFD